MMEMGGLHGAGAKVQRTEEMEGGKEDLQQRATEGDRGVGREGG